MSQYNLGHRIIGFHVSDDGFWRVRGFLWPESVLTANSDREPTFASEALALAAVQKSAGRTLRPVTGPTGPESIPPKKQW